MLLFSYTFSRPASGVLAALMGVSSLGAAESYVVRQGKEWTPYKHTLEIEPDSVFDFSKLVDAPAGKYGAIRVASDGHFEFAGRPGVHARFWGVNLTESANFPTKDEANALGDRLKRSGYNAVRFHHFDHGVVLDSGPDGVSHELNPETLDRLDYLFAALKQRGIYISIDLFSSRRFTVAELKSFGIDPADPRPGLRFKGMLPVSDAAFESWAAYSKNLLTHRNPYTGLTWAEDPALIGICLVNEDSISERINDTEAVRKRYETLFLQSLAEHGEAVKSTVTVAPAPADGTPQTAVLDNITEPTALTLGKGNKTKDDQTLLNTPEFIRFIHEKQRLSDRRMRKFLHSLGVQTPLTGANFRDYQGLSSLRQEYDYVDNHQYWDHPRLLGKGWTVPLGFGQTSATRGMVWTPRAMMPTRILGKPYALSEFNFVRPNRYRAEGGVIMPAYASLQEWDVMFNFEYAWSHKLFDGSVVSSIFSLATDPIGLLSDRLSSLIFLRGDIRPARGGIGFDVEPDIAFSTLKKSYPDYLRKLGLVMRVGTLPTDEVARAREIKKLDALLIDPASPRAAGVTDATSKNEHLYVADETLFPLLEQHGVIPKETIDILTETYRSVTGEIEINSSKGTMSVVTPRSELFVLPPQSRLSGRHAKVENGPAFGSVSVVSVDDKPLEQSGRILIVHLTDSLAEGMTFSAEDRKEVLGWGTLPHLVAKGGGAAFAGGSGSGAVAHMGRGRFRQAAARGAVYRDRRFRRRARSTDCGNGYGNTGLRDGAAVNFSTF